MSSSEATPAAVADASPSTSDPRPGVTIKRLRSHSSHESEYSPYQVTASAPLNAIPTDSTRDYDGIRSMYQALREKCDNLEARLAYYQSPKLQAAASASSGSGSALLHARKVSTLDSGAQVRLTEDELVSMRQIFNLFDKEGNGTISAHDLQALHQKLGEPITDDEATDMVREIGGSKGNISFEDFVQYWDGTHPSRRHVGNGATFSLDEEREKKRQWYQAKFKFAKARLTSNPTVARIYTKLEGVPPSFEFRVRFYYDDGAGPHQISPWHDIPYKNADNTFNMVCEIPKWSRRKFELATGEQFNPIKQDVRNGILREYTYGDMPMNYGCLPQTWEDPSLISPETQARGDSDPIDIVDIGTRMWATGSIIQVKILGVLAMIDAGETDWKVIAINTEDPFAELLNDIDDVHVHMPGCMESLHRWLKLYKTPIVNSFAFDGKVQNRKFALRVIEETHHQWVKLVESRGKSVILGGSTHATASSSTGAAPAAAEAAMQM